MWYKHLKVIYPTVVCYLECHKILTHKSENYRHARKNRIEHLLRRTCSRLLATNQALQNSCLKHVTVSLGHTALMELVSQRLLSRLSNHASFLFYSIIFNPQFWALIYVFEASFTDELVALNSYNLSVIIQTTQCLLSQVCI